jgi:hypothetical protein
MAPGIEAGTTGDEVERLVREGDFDTEFLAGVNGI